MRFSRARRAVRAMRPRSLAARTALAAALAASVLFSGGAVVMRHAAFNQQMSVAFADAGQESNLLLDGAATDSGGPPTGDDWGRFPFELVTSAGLLSSSSQLGAFETDGRAPTGRRAFMPPPPYAMPTADITSPTTAVFPDSAAVRGDVLAGTTTPVLTSIEIVQSLRSMYNNPRAMPGVPANAFLAVYVFITPFNAQAAVSALDRILYPAVPAAVLLVAVVAYLATRRALRPVEAIRARTAAVTATDPRERVHVPDTGDEIARLAETINDTLQRLENAAQSQRRFVADAAHELRSPLSSLSTTLQVAETYPDEVEWPETVATIAQQVHRTQNLAEDLLLLARMDATTRADNPSRTVDLAELVQDSSAEYRALSNADPPGRHIAVAWHTDGGPVLVSGDPKGLERVLRNLTDNAMRHARSHVDVRVYDARAEAVIEVEDDGSGIPAADRERIFERFTRLDDARSRETGGFGLGLAIVRDLVERHHGTITVTDAATGPGTGARFTVRLPRHPG